MMKSDYATKSGARPSHVGEVQIEDALVLELLPGSPSRVLVQLQAGSACDECGARIICKPADPTRRHLVVRASSPLPAPGTQVRVAVRGSRLLAATTLTYGLPLLGLCAGVGLGWLMFQGFPGREGLSFLTGLLLAALPLAWLYLSRRNQPEEEWLDAWVVNGNPTPPAREAETP